MSYTDFYTHKPRRVPILLAVLVGIGVMAAVIKFAIPSQKSQATKKGLESIQITNMYTGQVSIFWKTDKKQKGWIAYGENENDLSQIATDDRDGKDNTLHLYHIVTLKDLKKDTRYFFKITDGDAFLENGGKSLFTFKAIGTIDQINNLKPAYGKIIDKSGAPFQDAIVVLNAKNIYPLATLSKSTGEWLIPLNYTIDKATNNFISLSLTQPVRIHVYSDNENEAVVTASIQQLSPIEKPIQLGQTYVLQNDENVLSASSSKTISSVDISFPQQNAVIPAPRPLIKGIGPQNGTVQLVITGGNKPIIASVPIDTQGQWKYDVTSPLDPGKYVLTASIATAQKGKNDVKTRNFTIAKSGLQVLGEATGSASITPSSALSPTPVSNITPTITPIVVLNSPTPVPPTATPALIASASATPPPPVSGGNIYAVALTSVAMILFGAGLLVIF